MHTDWYSCHVHQAKRREGRMFSIIWCWQAYSSPFTLNYVQLQAGIKNRHILANFNFLTNRRAAFARTVLLNPVKSYNTFYKLLQKLFGILAKFSHEFVRAGLEAGEGWNRVSLNSRGWSYTCSKSSYLDFLRLGSQVSSAPKYNQLRTLIRPTCEPFKSNYIISASKHESKRGCDSTFHVVGSFIKCNTHECNAWGQKQTKEEIIPWLIHHKVNF